MPSVADVRSYFSAWFVGSTPQKFRMARFNHSACFLVLLAVIAAIYISLPKHGDIHWPDASRHALNGAFVLDFLRAVPFHHPVDFAYDYYRQYPALTILFYPPLFYVVLAVVYAFLGVSEASALITELAFLLLLAWGAFRLSRHWLEPLSALAVALLMLGAPQLAFWGQQVMLDVPAYAFLVWAGEFLVRYLSNRSKAALYGAVAATVAAIYTKYNAVFFAAVLGACVIYLHGWRVLRDGTVLRAAALGCVSLLPIVAIFFAFAGYDLEQAGSVPGSATRWSIAGLTYYLRIMPSVLSWPTVSLACLYVLALPFAPMFRLPRADAVFLSAWIVAGYGFYSMIALKEPRDILFITYPFVLAAILLLDRLLAQFRYRFAVVLTFAAGVLTQTLLNCTVPFVSGVRQAAEVVAAIAPPDTNIGFWGALDGTFIYAMRAYSGRPDLGVVRIDKLLFRDLEVHFEHGFTQNVMKPEQITDMLAQLHIQYVVMQTGFHDDLESVRMLETALASDKFTEIERMPMYANYRNAVTGELIVYRLNEEVPRGRVAPSMQIKLLGRSL